MANGSDSQANASQDPTPPPGPTADPVSGREILGLGLFFLVLALAIFYFLVASWPVLTADGKSFEPFHILWFGPLSFSQDARLFITVIVAGALGSLIHVLTSFADYVGNRQLGKNWIWWLVLRTPIGIALAVMLYLVLRGGLASQTTITTNTPYAAAAISALAGMFSKQATDKLKEIFETLFTPQKPVHRADPLSPGKPSVSGTVPVKLITGGATALTVNGIGFLQGCKATINGNGRTTEWVSDSQIKLTLLPADVTAAGKLALVVQNPAPNGGSSDAFSIVVE